MDIETKTDLGRLPLEIITPWSGLQHGFWSGAFNPSHPEQICTHRKVSSAFPLYIIIFYLAFCLLLLTL